MAKINVCFAQFFYRVNPNKTMDAICGFCFKSSATAEDQADLRRWETAHLCSELLKQPA
jgi:hypothetical protein